MASMATSSPMFTTVDFPGSGLVSPPAAGVMAIEMRAVPVLAAKLAVTVASPCNVTVVDAREESAMVPEPMTVQPVK